MSKYGRPQKFEILRSSGYYVTTFYRILYVRTGVPLSISRYSVVNYGTPASLAMDQVTRTPKRRSDGRSSFCGPAKRLKLTAVPLKRRSDCAKASAYGNMTPQLLKF